MLVDHGFNIASENLAFLICHVEESAFNPIDSVAVFLGESISQSFTLIQHLFLRSGQCKRAEHP